MICRNLPFFVISSRLKPFFLNWMALLPYAYDNVANKSTDVVAIFSLPSMKVYKTPKNLAILACVCLSRQKRVKMVGFSIRHNGTLQLTSIDIQLY